MGTLLRPLIRDVAEFMMERYTVLLPPCHAVATTTPIRAGLEQRGSDDCHKTARERLTTGYADFLATFDAAVPFR